MRLEQRGQQYLETALLQTSQGCGGLGPGPSSPAASRPPASAAATAVGSLLCAMPNWRLQPHFCVGSLVSWNALNAAFPP